MSIVQQLEGILKLKATPQFEYPEYECMKFVDEDGFTYYCTQDTKWYHFKFLMISAFINSGRNYGIINILTEENPVKNVIGRGLKKLYVSGNIEQISDVFCGEV